MKQMAAPAAEWPNRIKPHIQLSFIRAQNECIGHSGDGKNEKPQDVDLSIKKEGV
jgi:hypothetical protein